jgi:hypothetical protein
VLEKNRQERGEEDDVMDKSVSEIFHHFIGRAVTLEDLQKLSSQMLVGFQQALVQRHCSCDLPMGFHFAIS